MTARADILLVTLNARYMHASFGLRYLFANLGELRSRAAMLECTIAETPMVVAERILDREPTIVGLGVYIWNVTQTTAVVQLLKSMRPELVVVVGGPQISHETEQQALYQHVDHVVCGEGEVAFPWLCERVLAGAEVPKVIQGTLPETSTMALPYDLYTDEDIAHRVIYVEASRGCPFRCEFCLSALDKKVRSFPLDTFLDELQTLLDRGVRQFKFVDRTFNLSPKTSRRILQFFLDREPERLFVHFEMVPDRFPETLRALIAQFPPGSIQLEVGIQTFDETVAARIDRHQDNARILDNLAFLVHETGVHIHTDLIVGLPGEDMEGFAVGFDRLVSTGVQEIQVGILKRLPGAVIDHHTGPWEMVYSPLPPFEILRSKTWSRRDLGRMRRFARYWDHLANSGRFTTTMPLVLGEGSAFERIMDLSDWLHEQVGRDFGVSFNRWLSLLFRYLTQERGLAETDVAAALYEDHRQTTRKAHVPEVLKAFVSPGPHIPATRGGATPSRQRRHMA